MNEKILDLGCGNHKIPESVGVDFVKIPGVDIVHNLNKIPYPFKKVYTYFTFDYFGSNEQSYYTKSRVKILKRKFICASGRKSSILLKPLEWLANKIPMIYSHFFAFIFPISTIYFELQPIK